MQRVRAACVVMTVMLALGVGTAHAAELEWPGSELSRHAQAWFAMLKGDESAARKVLAEHFAPEALAEVSVEVRLARRAALLEQTQGLTPVEVVNDDPAQVGVRCRAGNGDDVVATFQGEAASPHRILEIRLEASPNGPGERRPVQPSGPPLEESDAVQQLRALLDQRAAAGEFSGVALLARGDKTLLEGAWGLADRAKNTPITPGTRFNLASIGKLITRTAVAQLAEQGKLSLDDKLSRFMPDFPHADSITVGMLCEHRSGVGDIFGDAYEAMDRSKLRHNRDYLPILRDQPLWFAPGTSHRYSNGGYVLLGEVIAKASLEDYYGYLAKHVFARPGMRDTSAPLEGDGTPNLARGYTRNGKPTGPERDNHDTLPARGSAAGGSYSTAADLLAFDRALLGGRLCSPAWAAWVTGGPRPDRFKGIRPESPEFGFAGGAPGINTEWTHEGDVTLIVLTNRDPETSGPVIQAVRDIVNRIKPPAKRTRS